MYSTKKCRKFKEKYKNHKKDVSLKKKSKKNKAKDAHLSYDSKSESNEDIKVDFSEELHPIGYYVKDRAEMINQMFSVIQGKKLRAMLPPLLKGHSVDELKSLCLGELLGMSEKRVMSVLEGRELETSSESDVNTSELEAEEKFAEEDHNENWCSDAEISSTTKTGDNDGTNDGGDMDTLEIGITREEMGELLNDMSCGENSQKNQPKEKRYEKLLKHNKLETNDLLTTKRKASEECASRRTFTQGQEREEDGTDKEDKSKGKTLLEILELEMRARAIRALLKQQGEDEGNIQNDIESETKMNKQSAYAITSDMDQQKADAIITNVVKRNAGAFTTNAAINETVPINLREKPHNSTTEKEDKNPQPRKKFKKTSGNVEKKNINDVVIDVTDNDKVEMNLVSTKIEVVDLTKEKLDAKEVGHCAGKPSKPVLSSRNEKSFRSSDKISTMSKNFGLQGKILYKDIIITSENRTALDKTKRRCYRTNQEEGEISSDDENKSDAAHTVKIESESDFDVITLDDSNDSICSLPRAERHVTIEKSNISKLTSVRGATNQRLYSEILRSNIKVYVKNKGKLKTRSVHFGEPSSSWSKNPKVQTQKGAEENRDEEQNKGIEGEDAASDMTWAARWLKSKGVQKVVKTSKVCAKMRKRMKNAQKKSQMTLQDTRGESKSPVHIIGSVKEYRMLDKPKALYSDSKRKFSEEKR